MERELIHSEIITFLKTSIWEEGKDHITSAADIILHLKHELGNEFNYKIQDMIYEEIHLLFINNILMKAPAWGYHLNEQNLKLTEDGKRCLKEGNIIPLDPSGYVEEIKKSVSNIDPIICEYLTESVTAFNRNLILSSTITLGVASEQAMLILMESFTCYIKNSDQFKSVKDTLEGEDYIFKKYKAFKDALSQLPRNVKSGFTQNFDVHIDTLFNFIRLNRNETGHPLGCDRDKNIQSANLQAFKSYLVGIYKLINFFKQTTLK